MEFRTTTQPFSEDISSSLPEITFCICKSNLQYHAISQAKAALGSPSALETNQTQQDHTESYRVIQSHTESTAERQLVDPSFFRLESDSGCFLVFSSCVAVYNKHNSKAHKAMETRKHYPPTIQMPASL